MNTRICHFDPFSGIAGGSPNRGLIDAGANSASFHKGLQDLKVIGLLKVGEESSSHHTKLL
jgi:uncharacterized protein (DUF111 family)